MRIRDVESLSVWDTYLYWITERESIRKKKEAGLPRPWTDDEILDTFKFCNVRRMDDRVSRWLMNNWYLPYKNHPNMLVACTLARQLNNTDSLGEIGFPEKWDADKVRNILEDRVRRGENNFSGAYMITGTLGGTKIVQIVDKVVDPIFQALRSKQLEIDTDRMESTWGRLLPFKGFSSFIAGQTVADLRYGLRGAWKDKHNWAPMGPGSKRGMNRLRSLPKDTPLKQSEFLEHFKKVRQRLQEDLPEEVYYRLEAIDIQNTLCEFDKYIRTLHGEGRPKQKYKGQV